MIFAAGLGTRLRPLTNDRPKALVEIRGMSLLEIQLRRLQAFGAEQVVVNIHHFAELMEERIEGLRKRLGMDIVISDERGLLLETGGGLKKAAELLLREPSSHSPSSEKPSSEKASSEKPSSEMGTISPIGADSGQRATPTSESKSSPILVVNVDVLTNLDYGRLLSHHRESNSLATLALRQRETSRYLVWDDQLGLRGWVHKGTGEVRGMLNSAEEIAVNDWQTLAFSGIQIISPEIFGLIRQEGKFSIIDTYLDLADTGRIHGYPHDGDLWLDVGKPETLARAIEVIDQVLP